MSTPIRWTILCDKDFADIMPLWEKEDALHEDIPILNYLVPKAFTHEGGKLTGVTFEKVRPEYDAKGRRSLVPSGEPDEHYACDDVLIAVGQENAFPWIEPDAGIAFDRWGLPVLLQPQSFFTPSMFLHRNQRTPDCL